MSSWKYITLVVCVLIGAALFFGNWVSKQFKYAFNNFDASYNQLSASLTTNTKLVSENKITTPTDFSEIATTTLDISIIFPKKEDDVYIGCDYEISWESNSTIKSIDIALVDAGTLKPAGPIASGLSATSSETELKGLDWKVGNVWPGQYYILISKINNQNIDKKSGIFIVNPKTEGICN